MTLESRSLPISHSEAISEAREGEKVLLAEELEGEMEGVVEGAVRGMVLTPSLEEAVGGDRMKQHLLFCSARKNQYPRACLPKKVHDGKDLAFLHTLYRQEKTI